MIVTKVDVSAFYRMLKLCLFFLFAVKGCANQITEDLVKVVGDIMYPNELKESFSVDVSNGQVRTQTSCND